MSEERMALFTTIGVSERDQLGAAVRDVVAACGASDGVVPLRRALLHVEGHETDRGGAGGLEPSAPPPGI
jgi:hypothetical protein